MINTWSREHLEIFARDYATASTDLLAIMFDTPRQQVTNKARSMGLLKSPEYLEAVRASAEMQGCRHHA